MAPFVRPAGTADKKPLYWALVICGLLVPLSFFLSWVPWNGFGTITTWVACPQGSALVQEGDSPYAADFNAGQSDGRGAWVAPLARGHAPGAAQQGHLGACTGGPNAAGARSAVLEEFMAAPWLLPPRTKAFPWAGVHDLDELAAMRTQKLGPFKGRVAGPTAGDGTPAAAHITAERSIVVLRFSRRVATMAQNCIYSLVKFGGVRNFLMAIGDDADLAACADLNLPCTNATAWLPERMNHDAGAGEFLIHDYLSTIWASVAVNTHLLQHGYAVMKTDTDIVYAVKPVWESYLRHMEAGRAGIDMAVLTDHGSLSAGSYVALPTPGTLSFFKNWLEFTAEGMKNGKIEQDYLGHGDMMGMRWRICFDTHSCIVARGEMDGSNMTGSAALLRSFLFNYHSYSGDNCHLARSAAGVVDVMGMCDWQMLFLHPVCASYEQKLALFKQQGMWFVDEQTCGAAVNGTLACHLLRWREDETEDHLYACPEFTLGLYHERPLRMLPGRPSRPPPFPMPGNQPPSADT